MTNGGLWLELLRVTILIIFCHVAGDYLLQTEYMAREKGQDIWVLVVHCICYCLPFYICFGFRWQLLLVFGTHVLIDWLSHWKKAFGILYDQYFHLVAALVYLFPVLIG